MPPAVPEVLTDRLRLRLHRADDLDPRVALYADAHALRHVGGAQDRAECWARIQRYVGHWALRGFGLLAVEERDGGRLVGEVGIGSFERGLGADFDPFAEAAWIVLGGGARGYATEAMSAVLAWFEHVHGPQRLVAVIHPDNAASLRVAEKLGFRIFAERAYRGTQCPLLERLPAERR